MYSLLRLILATIFLAAAGQADAAWHRASSRHFIIYANLDAKELRQFATRLEQFDLAVRALRNMEDHPVASSARLTIYMVRNVDAVRRLAGDRSRMVAGFYIARSSGAIAVVPEHAGGGGSFNANIVFFHEYAHHLMFDQIQQSVPSWFSEGFAEFFSTARFERDGSILIGVAPAHRSHGVFTTEGITYTRLLTGDYSMKMDASETESLYGRGWLLAHYLTFAPERKGQLTDYLSRIAKGERGPAAATNAFGDLRALEKEVKRYVTKSRLQSLRVKSDAAAIGNIEVRELTAGEAAIIPIRMRSKVGVTDKTAPDVMTRARRVARDHPNDALVAVTHAEASLDAKDLAGAIDAATLALQLDPKSVEARLMRGRALLARAAGGQGKAADIQAARDDFLAANKLEPEHPEPLRAFYESFFAANEAPTKNAVAALHYAATLAPADQGLRWMSAQQHLIDGQAAQARMALGPLAFDPHGGKRAEAAGEVIALIDAGKTRDALAALEKSSQEQDEGDDAS